MRSAQQNSTFTYCNYQHISFYIPFINTRVCSTTVLEIAEALDIEVIEKKLGKKAIRNLLPIQDGDVPETYADVDDLMRAVDFKPATSIETGIGKFIEWYLGYYKVKN